MKPYNLAPSISLSFLVYITGTLFASPNAVSATTINTLANFTYSGNNGATPTGDLFEDSQGNLYGTAFYGGTNNNGTIFKYTPGSGLSTLAEFNGTNGANPLSGLVVDSLGNFIGTTYDGGTSNKGTVFKYTPGSGISTLVNFNGTNGSTPGSGLLADSVGNLFGTTAGGGTFGYGTLFEYTPGSGISTLASFGGNGSGAYPNGELLKDSSGNLIGTTYSGGTNGNQNGTIFKYTSGSGLSTVAEFNGTNGAHPGSGLVSDSQGNLFGTTNSGGTSSDKGTVFEYTPGSGLVTLANFNGTNGANPSGGLLEDSQGNLFGTTGGGGADGLGTVFKLSTTGVSLDGTFNSTSPTCSSSQICTGLGTSHFSYGQPAQGSFSTQLSFAGQTYFQLPTGVFNAGTLTITNGSIVSGSYPAFRTSDTDRLTYINLNVAGTNNNNGEPVKSGDFLIAYDSTSNVNSVLTDPQNDDFVYFPQHPELGGFYISEGSTVDQAIASVSILAEDPPNSLTLVGFQALPGQTYGAIRALPPGSIDPTTGYYIPNSANPTTAVPEPSEVLGTLLFGAIGAGYLLKRQRRSNVAKHTEQY